MPPEVKIIEVYYEKDVDEQTKKGLNPVTIYPQCPYFKGKVEEWDDDDECGHPHANWHRCVTNHIKPIDSYSCPFDIHAELAKDPKIVTIKYHDGVSSYSFRFDDYIMKKGQNGDVMFEIIDKTYWRKPVFISIDPFGCIKYEYADPNAFTEWKHASSWSIGGEYLRTFP
jgi:hypothetical protein